LPARESSSRSTRGLFLGLVVWTAFWASPVGCSNGSATAADAGPPTGADGGVSSAESGGDSAPTDSGSSDVGKAGDAADGASPPEYTYEGCPVFGPGGWFDTDISNAAPDPKSSLYIKATVDAGDTGGFNVFVPTNELVNFATNATPLLTVKEKVAWHMFPFQVPWSPGFAIEPTTDAHAMGRRGRRRQEHDREQLRAAGGLERRPRLHRAGR
jgi:hypothetical protein